MADDGIDDCEYTDEDPLYVVIGGERIPKYRFGYIGDEIPQSEVVTGVSGWGAARVGKTLHIGTLYPMNKTAGKWKSNAE